MPLNRNPSSRSSGIARNEKLLSGSGEYKTELLPLSSGLKPQAFSPPSKKKKSAPLRGKGRSLIRGNAARSSCAMKARGFSRHVGQSNPLGRFGRPPSRLPLAALGLPVDMRMDFLEIDSMRSDIRLRALSSFRNNFTMIAFYPRFGTRPREVAKERLRSKSFPPSSSRLQACGDSECAEDDTCGEMQNPLEPSMRIDR